MSDPDRVRMQYTVGGTEEDYREDLVWTLKHPSSVKRAKKIDDKFGISSRLGLNTETDKILVWCYLAHRLMRIDIYNLNGRLEHPFGLSAVVTGIDFARYQFSRDTWERKLKRNKFFLRFLEEQTNEYVENIYSEPGVGQRAREIELAINDLVARSTVQQAGEAEAKLKLRSETLMVWSNQWSNRINNVS